VISVTGEWISVEDSSPKHLQDVYVGRDNTEGPRCAFPAHYRDGQYYVFDIMFGVCIFRNPTHWMPMILPDTPNDPE